MPFLAEFSVNELHRCIDQAYNSTTFDTDSVIDIVSPSSDLSIMELWHGPTAALRMWPSDNAGFMDVSRKNRQQVSLLSWWPLREIPEKRLWRVQKPGGISIIVFILTVE